MLTIPGYENLEQIQRGERSSVFRATRIADGLRVCLKVPAQQFPSSHEIVRYRHELAISQRFASAKNVLRVLELVNQADSLALVTEDFEAVSLEQALLVFQLSLEEILAFAVQLAGGLSEIHAQLVIHGDINPRNILVNADAVQLKITDFGIASAFSRKTPEVHSLQVLEGNLAYISPEQTGRMNRSVDYRTDFYSFGVTLYKMLTHKLPFDADDPLELVHAHLARAPISVAKQNPEIPRMLSDIVDKLMAKTAERRYQSALGVKADLERCLGLFRKHGSVPLFEIGQDDSTDRLVIPQKLYGREQEIEALLSGFERVVEGSREMALVAGPSGIGKTALVHEVHKPMTRHRGTFIYGKFDQFQRNTPYSGLLAAFLHLIRQLLSESEESLGRFRDKILAALGANAQVMVELVPELQALLGPQPAVPDLPPSEKENRFNLVMERFVCALAHKDHPLVLFLDDLQWADMASVKLIRLLMTSPSLSCFFLVGSYRDNEVSPSHPLMLSVKDILQAGEKVTSINLGPLTLDQLNQLVSEALHCPPDTCADLTSVVHQKTAGNPFFVAEFLGALHEEQLLSFDAARRAWRWDAGRIQKKGITDNVVEILANRIQQLHHDVQRALQAAACLGNRFELGELAWVLDLGQREALSILGPAMAAAYVAPLGEGHLAIEHGAEGADAPRVELGFSHDRVQQAAYSLIPEGERPALHHRIGRTLFAHHPLTVDESKLFAVVSHLNLGIADLASEGERDELAGLNLRAGKKAKQSAANEPAMRYLKTGLELLGPQGWSRQYPLALSLNEEAAEAAYLTMDFPLVAACVLQIEQNANTTLEKFRAFELQIKTHVAQDGPAEAVRYGMQVLKLLGMRFPAQPSVPRVLVGMLATKRAIRKATVQGILALPPMQDERAQAAIRIMRALAIPLFIYNPRLSVLMLMRQIGLVLKYGHPPLSGSIFGSFGIMLCGLLGDFDNGYQMGKLSLDLVDKHGQTGQKCRVSFLFNNFVRHWKEHPRHCLKPLLEAYQLGLETGDLEYAALSAHFYCQYSWLCGLPVKETLEQTLPLTSMIRRLGQTSPEIWSHNLEQVLANLQDGAADAAVLKGEHYDEDQALPVLQESGNHSGLAMLPFTKMMLCYYFGQYREAMELEKRMVPHLPAVRGILALVSVAFISSLTALGYHDEAPKAERKKLLKRVRANQKKLKKWAAANPAGSQNRYTLVQAELARVQQKDTQAIQLYEDAIRLSAQYDHVHDLALASELAGKFHLSRGRQTMAMSYLQNAHFAYSRWGAKGKVAELEKRYLVHYQQAQASAAGNLALLTSSVPTSISSSADTTITSTMEPTRKLDFLSVIKASQSISGEMALSSLLAKLMHIVIENAGAQKGLMILEQDGRLSVVARVLLEAGTEAETVSVPLEACDDVSPAIVHYVNRTKESVVLGDAANEGTFVNDAYVLKQRPRSVLCIPVLRPGSLVGILYLENNHTSDAFTPARVEVLKLLAAQAAISIDNAMLYERLELALEKARESYRVKSEFLAKTSHELRTPLNSIINIPKTLLGSFAEQPIALCSACSCAFGLDEGEAPPQGGDCLQCGTPGSVGPSSMVQYEGDLREVTEHLDIVIKSGTLLLHVVNDILDISKLEAGRVVLYPETFAVRKVVDEVLASSTGLAQQRQVTLDTGEIPEELTLTADRIKLSQILLNLMGNAIKFSPEGSHVLLDVKQSGEQVEFAVRDQGIGIAKEHHALIFESFRQVEGGATRRYGGTGLGLAITKNLVELHGGRIRLNSAPGQGSEFIVELPRQGPKPR